jgi:hypothetical protein
VCQWSVLYLLIKTANPHAMKRFTSGNTFLMCTTEIISMQIIILYHTPRLYNISTKVIVSAPVFKMLFILVVLYS